MSSCIQPHKAVIFVLFLLYSHLYSGLLPQIVEISHHIFATQSSGSLQVQVILFEFDCTTFFTNLHELFCQFISWTNWVNSGKFMDNCWISCQVMADMKKVYNDLIIVNLYLVRKFKLRWGIPSGSLIKLSFWYHLLNLQSRKYLRDCKFFPVVYLHFYLQLTKSFITNSYNF